MSSKQRSGGALSSSAFNEALEPGSNPANDVDRLLRQRARLIEWEERRRSGLAARLGLSGWGSNDGVIGYRRLLAFGALAVSLCVLVFWLGRSPERAILEATLGGQEQQLQENAWVTAAEGAENLSFSEGSQIVVAAGARARIAKLDRDGLRVTLEAGKLEASITPKTGYRWVVQAGPHTVTVLGTVFSVEWSAELQRLQVEVKRGRVLVESNEGRPMARELAAGESLTVVPPVLSAADGPQQGEIQAPGTQPQETPRGTQQQESQRDKTRRYEAALDGTLDDVSARDAARAPGPALTSRTPVASEGVGSQPTKSQSQSPSGVTPSASVVPNAAVPSSGSAWKQLADAGRYSEAVSAARSEGVSSLLGSTGATDLMLLADAARLGKAPELAQQVLLTIRERYPNHANATVAAFALGRLAFEVNRDDRAAVRWFQTYLEASPNGSMAEGARGRLLRAWMRLGDDAKARAAALEYLKHHPHGHHASVAQSLLGD